MKVKELMTADVQCGRENMTLREAAESMRQHRIGILPICNENRMRGTITDRDIVVRAVAHGFSPDKTLVRDVMTYRPVYCYDDQDIQDAAAIMEKEKIRRIPVMDRQERLVGMLSLDDFTKAQESRKIASEILDAVAAVQHA